MQTDEVTQVHVSASREKMERMLEDVLRRVRESREGHTFEIGVTVQPNEPGLDLYQLVFNNDDMERPEVADTVIVDFTD